jgi:hypothetical protein
VADLAFERRGGARDKRIKLAIGALSDFRLVANYVAKQRVVVRRVVAMSHKSNDWQISQTTG